MSEMIHNLTFLIKITTFLYNYKPDEQFCIKKASLEEHFWISIVVKL